MSSAGAQDPTFTVVWGAGTPVSYGSAAITAGIVLVGSFNTTLNGVARNRFAILDPVTGIPY